ncbi:MAG: nucleotidyl transferase AbiEii/AbiGii toxin family protein [Proteobacteria bacterium]|nr:nucleotidyl transferase AbiEii/AbiGii toxin family protein [Pseudomonadota bacterium]
MTISVGKLKMRLTERSNKRGQPYDKLQTLFFLERAAVRLIADTTLAKNLVFKGGFVSVRVYNSPRYTIDLDATLRGLERKEAESRIIESMSKPSQDGVWFSFDKLETTVHQGTYGGTRFVFRSGFDPMPASTAKCQVINIDIGTGDPVTPKPTINTTESEIAGDMLTWQVYPPETIIAEKLHTISKLGAINSRSKDIFDIHLLCNQANPIDLQAALAATFAFRGDKLPPSLSQQLSKTDRTMLKKGWQSAAGYLGAHVDFDTAFEEVVSWLEKNRL